MSRTRFERRVSADTVDKLRAKYREGQAGEVIGLLLEELEHAYQAILAPGYGFEAEMDRYEEHMAMGDRLVAELRETKARYEASVTIADGFARRIIALEKKNQFLETLHASALQTCDALAEQSARMRRRIAELGGEGVDDWLLPEKERTP